jgi:hypothetical protein
MPSDRYSIRQWNIYEGFDVEWRSFDCYARSSNGSKLSRYNRNGKLEYLYINDFHRCIQAPNINIYGSWNINDRLEDIAYITFNLKTDSLVSLNYDDNFKTVALKEIYIRNANATQDTDRIDKTLSKRIDRFAYETPLERTIIIGKLQDAKKKAKSVKISSYKQYADYEDDSWFYLPYENMKEIKIRLNSINLEYGQCLNQNGGIAVDQAIRTNLSVLGRELDLTNHDSTSSLLDTIAENADFTTLDPSLIYNHQLVNDLNVKLRSGTYLYVNGLKVYNVIYVLLHDKICRMPLKKYQINIGKIIESYFDNDYEDLCMVESVDGDIWRKITHGAPIEIGEGDNGGIIDKTLEFGKKSDTMPSKKVFHFMRRAYYKNDFLSSKSCSWKSSCRIKPLFCIEMY